jgi:hypothetical protein
MRHTLGIAAITLLPLLMAGGAWAQADPAAQAYQRYLQAMQERRIPPPVPVDLAPAMAEAAKEGLIKILKDPSSAVWGEVRAFQSTTPGRVEVCGQVNAKNSFGGYEGMQPYDVQLAPAGAGWLVTDAAIARPGRRGDFFDFAKVCNPANWQ